MRYAIRIPGFERSWLYATCREDGRPSAPDTAIVFVHGFLGDSEETWQGFPQLLPRDPWWDKADLYFLKYSSFRPSVEECTGPLLTLLGQIRQPPEEWFTVPPESFHPMIRDVFPRVALPRTPTRYSNLIVVGHSMGGLVTRLAALDLGREYRQAVAAARSAGRVEEEAPWLLHATLRLFAPALTGARPAGLLGLALVLGGIKHVAQALLGFSRSYQDMEKPTIPDGIRTQTAEVMAGALQSLPGFRADVLWADADDVVSDAVVYTGDHVARKAPDAPAGRKTNHRTVCKPTADYQTPLTFVRYGRRT